MINKATLLGRLTKDPVINYTQGEKSTCVARYTLAVTRKFKKDEADFISCVSFGNLAEIIQKYVSKGDQICVAGRIQTGSYTNREGQKVYTTDVVVEDMQMCGSKADKVKQSQEDTQAPTQAPTQEPAYEQQSFLPNAPATDDDGFMTIPEGIENELPFI